MTLSTEWVSAKLNSLGEIMGGRQRSPHLTKGRPRPYLRVANILDGYIDSADVNSMLFRDEEFERYQLRPGDVLLNEGQSVDLVGRSAIYEGVPPECAFQNTLIRFRANPDTNAEFAFWLFQYLHASGRFAAIASRTTSIAHLGVKRFASLTVAVPPFKEQRLIAEILSAHERASKDVASLTSAKRRFKHGLMQQLFGPAAVSGGRSSIHALGDVARVIMGTSPPSRSYNVSGTGLPLIQGMADIVNRRTISRVWTTEPTAICEVGDTILGVRAPVGDVARTDHRGCIGRGVAAIRAVSVDQSALYHALEFAESGWQRVSQGSTFTAVTGGAVRRFHVGLPTAMDQQVVAGKLLDTCDREIGLLTELQVALRRQQRALLDKLLSGELRLPAR